ncbi:2-carboxy-1,4-naphthoquinone phytyltransferase, chloroplastic isoform X2 [Ananas comosus]|uniref:2-carboxy-1,4-naphthoquinone phytyltransferase, chloroplastic isoform X2 n=1 Tax=Ananas comosus TaxID=4615 RepID=A0A6P5GDN0_ANACO|nr:2-carboxy-1,4-naphthoquinone phytyltransferase, chloroplastic isoform X2 [Ananas comosus]
MASILTPPTPLLLSKPSHPLLFPRILSSPPLGRGSAVGRPRSPLPLTRCSSKGLGAADEEISRATLLWRAAKLPIYSVALVPLTVGSAAAYLQTGLFFGKRYLVLLAASALVITWLNLSNDVYDFDTGADRDKKESVVNIIGSRTVTQIAAYICLALGFMGIVWAFAEARDTRFLLLITYAIICGYVYQCPPFRLSYQGLGEPLCFAAFGPFATTAFYFSNSSKNLLSGTGLLPLTRTVLSASVLVGLTTTLILFCSHFHQIDGDLAVGKMSPLVRIGTEAGSRIVKFGVTSLYVLLLVFGLSKALPSTCVFLCALTAPMGKLVADFVEQNHNDNIKIFMAKYYCVRLHAIFGAALAFGFFLGRRGITG